MTDPWLEDLDAKRAWSLLREHSVGRIAVVADEFPVVLAGELPARRNEWRDWVAVRTRPGNVLDRAPMPVAFEIDAIDPAHRKGWSVLVRGTLQHVNPDAADFRGAVRSGTVACSERDAWLVIEPFSITGRRLHGADSEWAFHPRALPLSQRVTATSRGRPLRSAPWLGSVRGGSLAIGGRHALFSREGRSRWGGHALVAYVDRVARCGGVGARADGIRREAALRASGKAGLRSARTQ